MLTQERLLEALYYDPDSGLFYRAKSKHFWLIGEVAGTLDHDYWCIKIDGVKYLAHRLAFLYMTGSMPDEVDHRNLNKSDNRWKNLRAATSQRNGQNKKLSRVNTSGIKGVCITNINSVLCAVGSVRGRNGKKLMKNWSINKWGREKALELAAEWVRNTRLIEHGEFANHG